MTAKWFARWAVLAAAALALGSAAEPPAQVRWGKAPGGEPIYLYTLRSGKGVAARITNFGAILVSLETPDRRGAAADIVLGFDTFDEYLKTRRYFGATIGRYANRIAHGAFKLDGQTYTLARNNGENALHGGPRGFHKAIWQGRVLPGPPPAVEFTYLSRDGEEGYPGNLRVTVRYSLSGNNELRLDYTATTDRPTVLNLTNHSFFNLAGEGSGQVLRHVVTIDADRFTPVDAGLIPTGEWKPVAGTPFDFRRPAAIGARIDDASDPQLAITKGYDHNYVLNGTAGRLRWVARVAEPDSGRTMEVLTTEPGMQFYSGNTLDDADRGKGHVYGRRSGFCMETHHFPDSPNRPEFPSVVLRPGGRFTSTTIYRFGAR